MRNGLEFAFSHNAPTVNSRPRSFPDRPSAPHRRWGRRRHSSHLPMFMRPPGFQVLLEAASTSDAGDAATGVRRRPADDRDSRLRAETRTLRLDRARRKGDEQFLAHLVTMPSGLRSRRCDAAGPGASRAEAPRKGPALAIAAGPGGPDDGLREGGQDAAGFVGDGSAGTDLRLVTGPGVPPRGREADSRGTRTESRRHDSSSMRRNSGPWMCPLPSGSGVRIRARAGPSGANIRRDAVPAFTSDGTGTRGAPLRALREQDPPRTHRLGDGRRPARLTGPLPRDVRQAAGTWGSRTGLPTVLFGPPTEFRTLCAWWSTNLVNNCWA